MLVVDWYIRRSRPGYMGCVSVDDHSAFVRAPRSDIVDLLDAELDECWKCAVRDITRRHGSLELPERPRITSLTDKPPPIPTIRLFRHK